MFGRKPEPVDPRVYLPDPEPWQARIKQGWDKDCCFAQNPGEDWFHNLVHGEIYLQRGDEKYCLACALRLGIVTHDRLNWQHGAKNRPRPVV
jgi:hypothetical protein